MSGTLYTYNMAGDQLGWPGTANQGSPFCGIVPQPTFENHVPQWFSKLFRRAALLLDRRFILLDRRDEPKKDYVPNVFEGIAEGSI